MQHVVTISLAITMTGFLTMILILPNDCTANITSLTTSDKAIYSASELERETLFGDFNYQENGTHNK